MQWPFGAMSLLNALFAHFHKLSDNTDDPIWVIRKQGHSDFKNIVYCIFLTLYKADKRARNKCFVMNHNNRYTSMWILRIPILVIVKIFVENTDIYNIFLY